MAAILFNVVELLKKLSISLPQRAPIMKSGENWSSHFREEDVERLYDFKQGQELKLPGDKILTVAKMFYHFNHTMQISACSSENDFQHFLHTRVWGCKFELAIERSRVIIESSFEQTWKTLSPLHYIHVPRFSFEAFFGSGEEDF